MIDTCGYYPRVVEQSVSLLHDTVPFYVFISSVSAYGDLSEPPTEDSPVAELPPDVTESLEFYGPLKAECERVVQRAYGDAAAIVRPGLIVGRTIRPAASRTGRIGSRAAATSSRPSRATTRCR